jgi:hypothetical protein
MSFTLDQTRKSTLRLYDAINHDQVFQLRSDLAASSITSAHPLTLNAQQVKIVNSSGQEVSDVVTNIKTIETNLASETSRATAAEVVNSQAISAEQLRATTAEGNLTTALNSEIANRTAAVLAEQTRAEAAETALSDSIATNVTNIASNTTKTKNILDTNNNHTIFNGALEAPTMFFDNIKPVGNAGGDISFYRGNGTGLVRIGTDGNFYVTDGDCVVNGDVSADSVIVNGTTPITDGGSGSVITTAERAQIGTNQTDIASEVARATAAEAAEASARQTAINDESAARFLADSTEAAARLAADNTLQTSIDVEKGRIDAILAGSSVNLDTLVELVNAYNSADTGLQDQITALQASVATLQSEKTLIQAQLDELLVNQS